MCIYIYIYICITFIYVCMYDHCFLVAQRTYNFCHFHSICTYLGTIYPELSYGLRSGWNLASECAKWPKGNMIQNHLSKLSCGRLPGGLQQSLRTKSGLGHFQLDRWIHKNAGRNKLFAWLWLWDRWKTTKRKTYQKEKVRLSLINQGNLWLKLPIWIKCTITIKLERKINFSCITW